MTERSDYKDHLRVRTANLEDLRAALLAQGVLIDFRQFRRVDFRSGALSELRLFPRCSRSSVKVVAGACNQLDLLFKAAA